MQLCLCILGAFGINTFITVSKGSVTQKWRTCGPNSLTYTLPLYCWRWEYREPRPVSHEEAVMGDLSKVCISFFPCSDHLVTLECLSCTCPGKSLSGILSILGYQERICHFRKWPSDGQNFTEAPAAYLPRGAWGEIMRKGQRWHIVCLQEAYSLGGGTLTWSGGQERWDWNEMVW